MKSDVEYSHETFDAMSDSMTQEIHRLIDEDIQKRLDDPPKWSYLKRLGKFEFSCDLTWWRFDYCYMRKARIYGIELLCFSIYWSKNS